MGVYSDALIRKLKTRRRERGLTQAELARRLFVARATVCDWEHGRSLPSSLLLLRLCVELSLPQAEMCTALVKAQAERGGGAA